jgi:hypothetical protein
MTALLSADCELRDRWFLEQDVNAWTSLAYVAAGIVIIVVVGRRGLPRAYLALGATTVLEGVGSWLYHGRSGEIAGLLHDVPTIGIAGFVGGWHIGRLWDGRTSAGALVGVAAGLVAGVLTWAGDATSAVFACFVLATATAELLARRRRLPAVWTPSLLVLVGVAAAAWVAGTSSSPVCDERSVVQFHGGWHILSALVVLAWMQRAVSAAAAAPSRRDARS